MAASSIAVVMMTARDTSTIAATVPVLKAAITVMVPVVKAVVTWHGALSLSDLQGVCTTCHYQLSALAATDS